MQGPDALDRVQYMPPDKVAHLHQADPDKRQKFSRTLEEEEEEAQKRRKKHPQDAVELKSEGDTENDRSEPNEGQAQAPEGVEVDHEENTESDKHIDLKA
jgi:hypothetical protein